MRRSHEPRHPDTAARTLVRGFAASDASRRNTLATGLPTPAGMRRAFGWRKIATGVADRTVPGPVQHSNHPPRAAKADTKARIGAITVLAPCLAFFGDETNGRQRA